MQRISIIGRSGGGKSTLAMRLGAKLDAPVVHLDALFFQPGWKPRTLEDFCERISAALVGERWIVDGNFGRAAHLHMAGADTVIWVDQSRSVCLRRAIVRVLRGYGRKRPDMAEGCKERFDLEFMRYIWDWDRDTRPKMERAIAQHAPAAQVVRLHSDAEIDAFLATI